MDVEEDKKFFGLCKCCLQDGCFRSLWVEYNEDGILQNYGEMLNECFSFHWQRPANILLEQICDDCARRAADAHSFRKQVLRSQEQLTYVQQTSDPAETLDTVSESEITLIVKDDDSLTGDPDEAIGVYEEVEYLEDVDNEELVDDPDVTAVTVKRKWPKKKKKNERLRTYKNYSQDELKQSIEAVKSGLMTPAEAAAHYKVPRKTVTAKILSFKRGEPSDAKTLKNDGMINEIRTLLTYTNATPYKTRTAHYHCAYCSTDGPLFEDPDELRTHTRTQHAGERTKNVEHILRPLWLNEVLKVDIENLHCTVCCVILVSWNDMFKHMKEHHDLDFDEAYTRVIPYILKSELRCALCKELFSNYHHLDSHMNAHYNNYMCSECGDTFLSENRLKKHLKIHKTGQFVCNECGKLFSLEKYRQKHIKLVHKQEQTIRCLYCPEKFLGAYPRHQHMLECHSEKVRAITCEFCGQMFDWRPYFLVHVRRKHKNEKNYKCSFCSQQFFMKSELRRHEDGHTNKGKYECSLCGKLYSSKAGVDKHYSSHDVVLELNDLETTVES